MDDTNSLMEWKNIRFKRHIIGRLIELGTLPDDTYYDVVPDKQLFINVYREDLMLGYSIGKKTIKEIELWLGRPLQRKPPRPSVCESTIEKAILLLTRLGYSISKPKSQENQDQQAWQVTE